MAAKQQALLETHSLVKRFRKRAVVRGVSIVLEPGEIVGLLGKNGAGKTTTFSMVVGFLRPDSGHISFQGRDITRLPMYRRARQGLAYLPQESSAFRQLTVRQNVLAVLQFRKLSKAEQARRCDTLLDELQIRHLEHAPAYTLSGGERRRTEIARALATEPKAFLLDEPFAGIDPISVHDLQSIVRELSQRGIGVLLTDHNVRETLHIADRAYIINEGEVIVGGTPQEVADDPLVREIYLGKQFRLDPAPAEP